MVKTSIKTNKGQVHPQSSLNFKLVLGYFQFSGPEINSNCEKITNFCFYNLKFLYNCALKKCKTRNLNIDQGLTSFERFLRSSFLWTKIILSFVTFEAIRNN